MTDDVGIRRIRDGDWRQIVALEAAAYTGLGLSEGRAALESKALASPSTCFVLAGGRGLSGYLLALPYPASRFPGLARSERPAQPPARPHNLHLHDMVVAEELRGAGLGRHLLSHLTGRARLEGYERISLVAVGGSRTFWAAHGFCAEPAAVDPVGYGPGSVYMSMALTPEPAPAPEPERAGRPAPAGGPPGGAPSRDEVG